MLPPSGTLCDAALTTDLYLEIESVDELSIKKSVNHILILHSAKKTLEIQEAKVPSKALVVGLKLFPLYPQKLQTVTSRFLFSPVGSQPCTVQACHLSDG